MDCFDNSQPKVAILQLGLRDNNHLRSFLGIDSLNRLFHETPDCNNYELVYIRNLENPVQTEYERTSLGEQLYTEFNANTPRPRNYYGHSLSVSDVIVISNRANEHYAYYVDNIGLAKLPDNFLHDIMNTRIHDNLDIRQEYEHFSDNQSSLMLDADKARFEYNRKEYTPIFRMADIRGAILDMTEWGYDYQFENPHGEVVWNKKSHTEDSFTLGNWDDVIEFVQDIHVLCNDHSFHELQSAIDSSGAFNPLLQEYGELAIQIAISIHPDQPDPIQSIAAQMIADVANKDSLSENCDIEL